MMTDDKTFRIRIAAKELRERLIKRVAFHEQRMKHYLKKESEALKEKLKKEKETMAREQAQVEELDLALAQERTSFRGISGFSGVSGYSGASGSRGTAKFEHVVVVGHSDKFVSHERAARKLAFMADHLKDEVYELTQYELDQLELV